MGKGNPTTPQSCQMPWSCDLGVAVMVMRQLQSGNKLTAQRTWWKCTGKLVLSPLPAHWQPKLNIVSHYSLHQIPHLHILMLWGVSEGFTTFSNTAFQENAGTSSYIHSSVCSLWNDLEESRWQLESRDSLSQRPFFQRRYGKMAESP